MDKRTSIGYVNSIERKRAAGSCRQKGSGLRWMCCTRFTVDVDCMYPEVLDLCTGAGISIYGFEGAS